MAAFPAGAIQEGRQRTLFRSVSAFGRAAADTQFHAQEIRCAHLWPRLAHRTRIKIGHYQVPMRLSEIGVEQYRERVVHGCEFLEGHSREMIAALGEEMRHAAEKKNFEK